MELFDISQVGYSCSKELIEQFIIENYKFDTYYDDTEYNSALEIEYTEYTSDYVIWDINKNKLYKHGDYTSVNSDDEDIEEYSNFDIYFNAKENIVYYDIG